MHRQTMRPGPPARDGLERLEIAREVMAGRLRADCVAGASAKSSFSQPLENTQNREIADFTVQ
jgi:hypothetical protein